MHEIDDQSYITVQPVWPWSNQMPSEKLRELLVLIKVQIVIKGKVLWGKNLEVWFQLWGPT